MPFGADVILDLTMPGLRRQLGLAGPKEDNSSYKEI
jgi:hypothetical protein